VRLRIFLLASVPLWACSDAKPAARVGQPPAAGREDVRPRIAEAIRTEVEPLQGREDVASYLDRLRARAVAQGRVTALEVEPGVAAIERLAPELGGDATQEWIVRFTVSMAELSQSHRQ
jgi:hypothetical protein